MIRDAFRTARPHGPIALVVAFALLQSCLPAGTPTTDASPIPTVSSDAPIFSIAGETFAPFTLQAGQSLQAEGLTLAMQTDGNFVLYEGSTALWNTGTSGMSCASGCEAAFQSDGNLVLYQNSTAYWNSGTSGNAGAELAISSSMPFLSIVNASGTAIWAGAGQIPTSGVGVTVNNAGSGSACNSVSFYQLPTNANYFIGRVLQTTAAGPCTGSGFGLAMFQMDWSTNTLNFTNYILLPGTSGFTVPGTKMVITSVYDATAIVYNGQTWVAFECAGTNLGPSSSCIAPLDSSGALDTTHLSVVIQGMSQGSGSPNAYSSSVPKLLLFQNNVYMYWSVNQYVNGVNVGTTVRGTELQLDSSTGQFWASATPGASELSYSPSQNDEVLGVNAADPMSNGLADMFQAFTDGTHIYVLAGVGGQGCTTPVSGIFGCYRLFMTRTTTPLGNDVFNNGNELQSPQLPFNPQGYSHISQTPDGSLFIMGYYNSPTFNGSAQPGSTITPGLVTYPIALGNFVFATANGEQMTSPQPQPTSSASYLGMTFDVLDVFQSTCDPSAPSSLYCNSAIKRFCVSQGYAAGGFGPEQVSGNNLGVTCVGSSRAALLGTTLAELATFDSNCTSALAFSDVCDSAINRYCLALGFGAGGFGPSEINGNDVDVTCVQSGQGEEVGATYTELSDFQSTCTSTGIMTTSTCLAAVDDYCTEQGALGGYGILEHAGNDATIGCFEP